MATVKKPTGKFIHEPNKDRILVKPDDKLAKTAGGIIIPDTVAQKPSQGEVTLVGENCDFVKVGDRVMFSKDAGIPLVLDEGERLLMRESEIFLKSKKVS